MKLQYLTPEYFDEVVRRVENSDGFVSIGVRDKEEWLEKFKEQKPWIKTIDLSHVKGNVYRVSAEI